MQKRVLSLLFVLCLIPYFKVLAQQQYCIDASEYNNWFCLNVKGAQIFCNANRFHGPFPDYNTCEWNRVSALPGDVRWQRMTKCIPCRLYSPKPDGPSAPSTGEHLFLEEQKISKKIEEYRLDLKNRGCGDSALKFFDNVVKTRRDYGTNLKDYALVLDANYQIIVDSCENKKIFHRIIEEEKRKRESLAKNKAILLSKIKRVTGQMLNVNSTYPSLNPILINLKREAPLVDGKDPLILKKIVNWHKEELESSLIDWLSEKTQLPLDKLEKALSVGSLIREAVIEPVFQYLEDVKSALGNEAKWEALALRSLDVVSDADRKIKSEARETLAREFLDRIPKVGGLLSKFYSAGETTLEILEDHK